jgi:small subunit ribosomal protein S17
MSPTSPDTQDERGARRTITGTVTSDKMDKTVVVTVIRRVRDRRFHKFVTRRVKYKAHDEKNLAKAGDFVEIIESRPMSRSKRWRVLNILQKSREVPAIEAAAGASGRKSGPSEK